LISKSLSGFNSQINIYPNPSNGIFNIDRAIEGSTLRIFNAFGEEIKQLELSTNDMIDLIDQPKSVYFIRIETEAGSHFEKLILN